MSRSSKSTTSGDKVRVRILRFDAETDAEPRYECYEVPHEPHMRILDVLDYVHETLARDIGYRWLCGVKRCGTCAVNVNGSPVLACWEPAQPEMTIEPLANLPVIRDLVTDRKPYDECLAALAPLLDRRDPYPGFPEPLSEGDMAPAVHLRDCIQCLACQAACPVVAQSDTGFAGPAPLVALAELALDPRDGADRAALAEDVARVSKCVSCYECERVCPAEIPIVSEAIEPLKRMVCARDKGPASRHAQAFLEIVKEYGRVNAPRLLLRTKGLTPDNLRKGLRMAKRGKINLAGDLLGKPAAGARAVRKALESSEKDE